MANHTLVDDLLELDFPTPSTSFDNNEASGIEPSFVKPEVINITEHSNGTIIDHASEGSLQHLLLSYVGHHYWLLYTILGGLALLLVLFIAGIVWFLMKNKKRVIRQDDDPILTSTYDSGTDWYCRRLCCRGSIEKREQAMRIRQNSASNMDPYKRQPLPPIGTQPNSQHFNISTFKRSNVLEDDAISDKHLAIHIQGIRGVPNVPLKADQYRKLPPLRRE